VFTASYQGWYANTCSAVCGYKLSKVTVPSQCGRMVQAQLTEIQFKVLLNDDQIKKEMEDTCILVCHHCSIQERIDIKSIRNQSPFTCLTCEMNDENQIDQRTLTPYASTTTTQTSCSYYLHHSYPETVVTSQIAVSHDCVSINY
jgi:hypothetical protein